MAAFLSLFLSGLRRFWPTVESEVEKAGGMYVFLDVPDSLRPINVQTATAPQTIGCITAAPGFLPRTASTQLVPSPRPHLLHALFLSRYCNDFFSGPPQMCVWWMALSNPSSHLRRKKIGWRRWW